MASHRSNPSVKKEVAARLRSIEGHVRGVQRMLEEDAYCIDVIRQTTAIKAAIDRINSLLLDNHLHHCVTAAVKSSDPAQRERVLGEIVEVFDAASKG
ncbi:MAG: metal-sensitive transcriptional regulator [Armatimonadetes bacterium]|nr:metal-sensitive transcriptional regulator [Armatimonadota bacterium]